MLVLFAGLLLSGCEQNSQPAESGKTIAVVYLNVMETGDDDDDDDDSSPDDVLEGILAANAAAPLLNNGDRVEVLYPTQKVSPQMLERTIADYVEKHNISAILLGSNSKILLDIKQVVNAFSIPTLAIVATHPDVTTEVSYISQLSFDDERQGNAAALYVRDELLVGRAAVFFDETDPYSGYLGQVFRTRFEQAGGTINGFELASQLNQASLRALMEKNTEVIYLPLGAKQVLDAMSELRTLGWTPVVMGSDGLLAHADRHYPERSSELEGVLVTDLFTQTQDSSPIPRFARRVFGKFDEMFGGRENSETGLGIEGYRVVRKALEKCPDRHNPNCINNSIRSGEPQRGLISQIAIGANGKAERPIYINKIVDRKLEMMVKVN